MNKKECNDIQKSIEECKNTLDNFDKEFSKNIPIAFQDYNKAVDGKRQELQVSLNKCIIIVIIILIFKKYMLKLLI